MNVTCPTAQLRKIKMSYLQNEIKHEFFSKKNNNRRISPWCRVRRINARTDAVEARLKLERAQNFWAPSFIRLWVSGSGLRYWGFQNKISLSLLHKKSIFKKFWVSSFIGLLRKLSPVVVSNEFFFNACFSSGLGLWAWVGTRSSSRQDCEILSAPATAAAAFPATYYISWSQSCEIRKKSFRHRQGKTIKKLSWQMIKVKNWSIKTSMT